MQRRDFLILGVAAVPALAAQAKDLRLIVKVTYNGAGKVDDSHKIFVAVWDTPDFVKGDGQSQPVALKSTASNGGSIEFDDLQKSPAYVSMVYDPTGKWDAASAPPPGSSLGLYMTDPGTPAPINIESGKPAKIEAQFDDSFKMQ